LIFIILKLLEIPSAKKTVLELIIWVIEMFQGIYNHGNLFESGIRDQLITNKSINQASDHPPVDTSSFKVITIEDYQEDNNSLKSNLPSFEAITPEKIHGDLIMKDLQITNTRTSQASNHTSVIEDAHAFLSKLQENVDNKSLKVIDSFAMYFLNDDKPQFLLRINSPDVHTFQDVPIVDRNVLSQMLIEFGIDEKYICCETNSGDFQSAMLKNTVQDEKQEEFDNKYPCLHSELGSSIVSSAGSSTRGLMIQLKDNVVPKDFPNLNPEKPIYANVGASHTAPRILTLKQINSSFNFS